MWRFNSFLSSILLILSSINVFSQIKLAVLPFENLSSDKNYNWLSKGFAESLTSAFTQLNNFVVVERVQVDKIVTEQDFQLSDFSDNSKAAEVGRMLAAGKLLIGSFQIFENQINVNCRIVDVSTGAVDGKGVIKITDKLSNLFMLQEQICSRLAMAFGTLGVSEKEQIASYTSKSTSSLDAYKYFLLAQDKSRINDEESAISYLKKSIELDSSYSISYLFLGTLHVLIRKDYAKAISFYQKALKFNPNLIVAHLLIAETQQKSGDSDAAIFTLRQTIENNPNYDMAYFTLGRFYFERYDLVNAKKYLEQAVIINPYCYNAYSNLAMIYLITNDDENVQRTLKTYESIHRIFLLGDEHLAIIKGCWGLYHLYHSNPAIASQYFEEAIKLNPTKPEYYRELATSYAMIMDVENINSVRKAFEMYQQYLRLVPNDSDALKTVKDLKEIIENY